MKTITTQQEDPSGLLLRMLGESNSKNYGQQVTWHTVNDDAALDAARTGRPCPPDLPKEDEGRSERIGACLDDFILQNEAL